MLAAMVVFIVVTAAVLGIYTAARRLPGAKERRSIARRLREVQQTGDVPDNLIMQQASGPVPALDRLLQPTGAGAYLARLIDQAGSTATPSAVIVRSLGAGLAAALLTQIFIRQPIFLLITVPGAASVPFFWLLQQRSSRLKKFEEQFPDALDLVSRAIRAGHAFQAALGMVAEELRPPVGPEFKKTFEQQNYGLPLRDALNALVERVPLLDVKFFVTAVAIQRDTGGNLAEILDNLSHVVRERFKLHRQVRTHTAHGRITGLVLVSLPAFLAVALSFLNPDHMKLLFQERTGQMMMVAAVVMQVIGFFWIRRVMKIEV